MSGVVKVAGVQMEPRLLEKEENLSLCLEMIRVTAKAGARLIVFPECALTGYVFNSLEEAAPMAEPIPGPSTEKMLDACREFNVYVIVGLLEREAAVVFNSAASWDPGCGYPARAGRK